MVGPVARPPSPAPRVTPFTKDPLYLMLAWRRWTPVPPRLHRVNRGRCPKPVMPAPRWRCAEHPWRDGARHRNPPSTRTGCRRVLPSSISVLPLPPGYALLLPLLSRIVAAGAGIVSRLMKSVSADLAGDGEVHRLRRHRNREGASDRDGNVPSCAWCIPFCMTCPKSFRCFPARGGGGQKALRNAPFGGSGRKANTALDSHATLCEKKMTVLQK